MVQGTFGGASTPSPSQNFGDISISDDILLGQGDPIPPDTNGAVGPKNYVQIVNVLFAVYDKIGNLEFGPVATNTLWGGSGEPANVTMTVTQ